MSPTIVLKFGSSVLGSEADLDVAVHETYRHLRAGLRVVAVVSALGDTTDRLLGEARGFDPAPDSPHLAALVASGEHDAACRLALALERTGLPAHLRGAAEVGLLAEGPRLDARPSGLDVAEVRRLLERRPVLVLPGYVGLDEGGEPKLFGRGGSDLSALFLARELGAACSLLKDVPGLYESDPARALPGQPKPRRFARLSWQRALDLAGEVLQAKAARFARDHRVSFTLGAPSEEDGTRVGGLEDSFATEAEARPLRVALAGLGAVGRSVLDLLVAQPERFEVVGLLARRPERHRAGLPPALAARVTGDAAAFTALGADVLVELIGGQEPAGGLVSAALAAGRDVVSANKALLAQRGPELERLARVRGRRLYASAAAGGAVPALERARAGGPPPVAFEGVLNGTTSFVLDRVAEGDDLEVALVRAREAGLAEADPRADLEGLDGAHKLVLLAREGLGLELPLAAIEREAIDAERVERVRAAAAAGRRTRQVVWVERGPAGTARGGVRLEDLPEDSPLGLAGPGNALWIDRADGSRELLCGAGAGGRPTAESVLGDLLDLHRSRRPAKQGARA